MRACHLRWLLALAVAAGAAAASVPPDAASAGTAQASDAHRELGAVLDRILSDSSIPGAAVVLVEDGRIAWQHYYGMADVAGRRPVNAETIFRAGSVSKNVVALLAMRLAEQRRVDLAMPVEDLLPPRAPGASWHAADPIRLVHLLEHTAGLAGSSYADYAANAVDVAPGEYVASVGELQLRWRPGAFYSYSNPGYTIAAHVIERLTGQDFDRLVRAEVFGPLGMDTASFRTHGADAAQMAKSYDTRGREQSVWAMRGRPAGALSATAQDLARLVELYVGRGTTRDGIALLPLHAMQRIEQGESSLAAAAGVRYGSYGLGNFGFLVDGWVFRGHWGRTEGFQANLGYLPDTGRGFVLMVNGSDRAATARLRSAIAAHLTRGLAPPQVPHDPTRQADARAGGWYVNATHDMPLRAWLFSLLEQRHIRSAGDALEVEETGAAGSQVRRFVPAPGGGYAAADVPVATGALVEEQGRRYWVDGEAFEQVSWLQARGLYWLVISALLASAAACLLAVAKAVAWALARMRGRPARPPGAWLLSFAAAGVGLLGTLALFVRYGLLGSAEDLHALGRTTPLSMLIAALSVLAAAGSLGALASTLRATWQRPGAALVAAWPAGLAMSGTALLWFANGWVPLMTWRP